MSKTHKELQEDAEMLSVTKKMRDMYFDKHGYFSDDYVIYNWYWNIEPIKPIDHKKAYNKIIEMVERPKHYKFFEMEAIDIIRASMTKEQFIGYCKGNALKYRLRAGKKDDTLQDIAKAEEYEKFYHMEINK